MKRCTKCGKEYPETREFFYKNGKGLRPDCAACVRARVAVWNESHRVPISDRKRAAYRRTRPELRLTVLEHYSGGEPRCACCGETEVAFLAIDHINGGGNRHRREGARDMVSWIRTNNFPPGFQILCMNCNWAKHVHGTCPHAKAVSKHSG